ncbi:hypothetical protein LPJ66_011755 [Kickxella alabastrina]|uniref:Uncharacterized protein n=1 Tax=Kickxella alabastrina TaxID=61397 RepID=A0ACC1I0F8_9FUNG|nr:hypothetical protein LPJ66_011755 [Kickxella alabastrina]
MIDLDDAETRIIYDVVSQFRHNKSMTELEFPAVLSTKHRQLVMLIAERFGLNHETKSNEEGRCVRIYKGLATLLEGTEARRRSVASPNPAGLSNGGIGSHAGTQRHPRGPEMSQNFVARQQMHQQDERQIQRQTQLKVLQQNRQRRLSSTAENNNDTPSTPAAVATTAAAAAASPAESLSSSTFKIEKPLSKAIPIVRPPGDNDSKYRSLSASPLIPNLTVEQTKQH